MSAQAPAIAGTVRKNANGVLSGAAPILILLAMWEALSRLRILDASLFPPPSRILATAVTLVGLGPGHPQDILLPFLAISLRRIAIGFVIGAVAGVAAGMLIGSVKALRWLVRPIISMILPLPMLAWVPIFLLALGRGDGTVIAVIVADVLFPTLYHTIAGIRSIRRHHEWAVLSMGGSRWDVARLAWIPGMLPQVITGLKISAGLAWRALVVAEMVGADSGIGYMIFAARQYMATSQMFLGIAIIGAGGYLTERVLLTALERRTIYRWGLVREA